MCHIKGGDQYIGISLDSNILSFDLHFCFGCTLNFLIIIGLGLLFWKDMAMKEMTHPNEKG